MTEGTPGVHCRSCGKTLTAPTSQALHLGPVCFARLVGATSRKAAAVHEGQLALDLVDGLDQITQPEGAAR